MTTNYSTNYSNDTTSSMDVGTYYLYCVEGLILIVFNSILVLIIFSTRKLRSQKEYIIFAMNMVFDAIFGLTYFSAGIYRLFFIYYKEEYIPLYTKWMCFTTLHVLCFVIITPGAGIITLISAIDRAISVFYPIKYLRLSIRYAHFLMLCSFLCVIPPFVVAAISSSRLNINYDVPKTCNLQHGVTSEMFQALRGIRIVATIFGALMYLPISIKIYRIIKSGPSYNINSKQRKKLLSMTITVVLITVSQIALFTVPDVYMVLNATTSSTVFYILNLNKGIVNIIIFMFTQKDLRKAIWSRTKNWAENRTVMFSHTKGIKTVARASTKPRFVTIARTVVV